MNLFIVENKKFSGFLDEESKIYKDLNYEYALLDDSHLDVQSELSCNSTSTITSRNLVEGESSSFIKGKNFTFTEAVSNFIKAYSNSNLVESNNLENNIDWLDSELDIISEAGFNESHIVDFNNEELDIEISNYKTNKVSEQCIVLDFIDGKIQQYTNSRYQLLKQLMSIWELDFPTIDSMIKQSQPKILETLSVCQSHFNFDEDGLHECGIKQYTSIEKSLIHRC
ncbi:11875_t:CDS:1 [Cetraspora pellucida]|uniref:11875_t:CDS:1 n=1 Tax=Cetraspora pellucida TaxID=1433469 RepID=A0ACA9NIN7_9GLOM|nr:11875_t:CDS:1 [Cetraspora pellucida]